MTFAGGHADSYGPLPMNPPASLAPGTGLRLGLVVIATVACSAILGGCHGDRPASGAPRPRIRADASDRRHTHPAGVSVPIDTVPGAGQDVAQIASGWLAAERAFESAARSADAYEPDLLATTAAPILATATGYLQHMRASDEIATGPPADLGSPVVAQVSARLATVEDCAYDSEIVVDRLTRRPVSGIAGQIEHERFSSVMERTTTGWELAEQSVEEVPVCTGS